MKIYQLILIIFLLASCVQKEIKPTVEESYLKAKKILDNKNYFDAADAFDKIIDDFPFSKWSLKSYSMTVFAKYKDNKDEEVLQICDEFLNLYPNSEYAPYMLYMKGLVHYNQIPTISRSQDRSKEAYLIYKEFQSRFANTKYRQDVDQKLIFVNEHLAGELMSVGRYQMRKQNYNGAVKNFYQVVSLYDSSKQASEAYYRIAEIYNKIGIKRNSVQVAKILEKKYPDNYWTKLALNLK